MNSMIYDTMEDHFSDIIPKYDEDSSVIDAYHRFLDWSSKELFSSDSVRPVKSLKPFIKPKLIAQLSEYLPLQFPIEKVLNILDLSNNLELEYASTVITRDYGRLQVLNTRLATNLLHTQQIIDDEKIQQCR